MVNRTEIYL